MPTHAHRQFAAALKELRTAVTFCCWALGVALLAQTVVWSLLTFTDLRYRVVEAAARPEAATEVLGAEELRRQAVRETGDGQNDAGRAPIDINRQYSGADTVFRTVTGISIATGTMAAVTLLPLLGLAVLLAAGAATPGVNRAAGAFVWAVVLVMLTLPLSHLFANVPFDGLFASYAAMSADVEMSRGNPMPGHDSATDGGVLFYGRYCLLPVMCLAGIAATGLRFRAGIEAGVIPAENFQLDPELEREVSRIKTGSLIGGGRVIGALQSALKPGQPEMKTASLREISPGEPLQRPI